MYTIRPGAARLPPPIRLAKGSRNDRRSGPMDVNRRQMLTASAFAAGTVIVSLEAEDSRFGIVGDGVADDAPAIQAALDYVGAHGGGVVALPPPRVHYRIATGLKLPSFVTLEGPAPVNYPFNRANPGVCALVADFADPAQWIAEPKTKVNGAPVRFDLLVSDALPDGVTYNCGVRNLLITSKGSVPFGGIRMHGCPGAFVDGVAIDRVGCGLLVNYCFGGKYQVHVDAIYYGIAAWEDANANIFEAYCSHRIPWPTLVPEGYLLPFMRDLRDGLVDVHKLSTPDHATRPFGILCGATKSTSTNNVFDVVVEQFPGGMFLLNAHATDFRRCYLEGEANRMNHAIVASRSRFSIQALHAYLSNSGALFDLGLLITGKVFASGILYTSTFGKMPPDDGSSLLIFEGIDPGAGGAPIIPAIRYLTRPMAWIPLTLQSGWRPAGSKYAAPAVRLDPWAQQIALRGTLRGGVAGVCSVLPPDLRPAERRCYLVPGGQIDVADDGQITVTPTGSLLSLDGVTFEPW